MTMLASTENYKEKFLELRELIYKLNDDLNDEKKVMHWLTFITFPRRDIGDFNTVEFMTEENYDIGIKGIVDLVSDIYPEDEEE